ncbi:MAG: DUF1571 domain-containing protein [Deltaproteobacteria bacterium]|nr:DUF1571 domain-containing protein [Deltaproteobacteria bacterium]MCB9478235.1 DUF1571 domain-containing protein [Deltaproteobacteria bacterium]MCB9487212.1 DUF1571 domain-containing protein [Deltaproteobacteria bacterium]
MSRSRLPRRPVRAIAHRLVPHRRLFHVLLTALALAIALASAPHPLQAQDDAAAVEAAKAKVDAAFADFKDATYSVTFQHRVKGTMRDKETVTGKARLDGSIYMKWTGNRYKGRELLLVPGWNKGEAWIKEGGPLEFAAVSVEKGNPIIADDYRRGIEFLNVHSIYGEYQNYLKSGTVEVVAGGNGVKVTTPENIVTVIGEGGSVLKSITIADASGKVLEDYQISDYKLNPGLSDADFSVDNKAYGFPGYDATGIYVDPEMLKKNLKASYARVNDYTCILHKRELVDGKMQDLQHMAVKFKKPMSLYMKWQPGPHEGRQLIYVRGQNDNKAHVKEAGILGVVPVNLSLDSKLMKADTNHPLSEIDMGFTVDTIYKNLSKALVEGDVTLTFVGQRRLGNRVAYVVDAVHENVETKGYYAKRSVNAFDRATGLPIASKSYNTAGELFEEFEWTDLKLNVGLTDADFDYDKYGM